MLRLRRCLIAALVGVLATLPGCGDSDSDSDEEAGGTTSTLEDRLDELSGAGVFVGGVAFTTNLVAIHFDRKDEDAPGMRVFVTDGLPDGNAEWFEGKASGDTFSFGSTSGKATIEGTIEEFETDGTITLADGQKRNFFTRPAGDGAGVFEVTIGQDGAWKGTSLDGSKLNAHQTGQFVEGDVVSTRGERYPFRHNDLTRRLGYAREGGAAGTYLTVVTRQATEIQGRGGDIRGGKPGADVISLDLSVDGQPTPGVFHGRVANSTDRLNFELETTDGNRTVRSYVSDSEPEPAGDIQWFAGPVTGAAFTLTSKTGDARMSGTIADDGIAGELTLPDGVARRFFAAPSGQGAGIYTVEVAEDRRHTGTSTQGAKLDLRFENGTVMGTLTAPDGQDYPMLGADLAHAFRYDDEYSKPDTYVAFVAPRGRYVYGRNGDVRGGRPGVNIIGLDKKC
jgi:hypothetical protein